ncbi:helix-turn-helix transcriptional regulator [Amycolatopsis taiwanensis]|uniref:helix-turn-helix transcriptional regulator n=1 Tax=Amycolatopsis taiwanensis TaxID=342230 RepID=UPI0025555F04|nr:response regulator transcription factor [Amycolatopsis taiwanensis]
MLPNVTRLDGAARTRRPVVRVAVRADDPLTRAGLIGELQGGPGIELLDDAEDADVVVAVAGPDLDSLPGGRARLVLIADRPRPAHLWPAIEHGLAVLVPRGEVTTARLLRAIADAHHGRGDLPADQLGSLLRGLTRLHAETLAPRDLTLSGLSRRETDVLRLLADGLDTAEIATRLTYSERTVKNIVHGLLTRLGLRNRTHAVAYALRHELI